MNNELNIIAEPVNEEDIISNCIYAIQAVSMNAQGLAVLVKNLHQELENGNRSLTLEQAHDEAMSALSYIASALKHMESDLDEATRTADNCQLQLRIQNKAS